MKMVAAARLNRAQQRITELRPYAVKTMEVSPRRRSPGRRRGVQPVHPLLARRPRRRCSSWCITSDRGLAAPSTPTSSLAMREWREREAEGVEVTFAVIGRKGRDLPPPRGTIASRLPGDLRRPRPREGRDRPASSPRQLPKGEVDAVYVVYNEFKSAISARRCVQPCPIWPTPHEKAEARPGPASSSSIYEPNKEALLERLLPMYVEISVYRALLESRPASTAPA
jgi:F-type H+-transporting ATPase subunit gamma